MHEHTALMIMVALAVAEALLWLFGLTLLFRAWTRLDPLPESAIVAMAEANFLPHCDRLAGQTFVQETPRESIDRLKSAIDDSKLNPYYPVLTIKQYSNSELIIERKTLSDSAPLPTHIPYLSMQFFQPINSKATQIDFVLYTRPPRGWLIGGLILQLLGLCVLGFAIWIMLTFVVSNADAAIRVQAVQMVQVGHFLWPIFLLLGKVRALRIQTIQNWAAWLQFVLIHSRAGVSAQ